MAGKKKVVGGIAVLVLILLVIGGIVMKSMQPDAQENSTLVADKRAQLSDIENYRSAQDAKSEAYNPATRDSSLRDSGREAVGLFIRNTYFRVVGEIAFDVTRLSALLRPRESGAPVVLDDPTSFVFEPLSGEVTLRPLALSALFNQYLTDYPGSSLRGIEATTMPDGSLEVTGEASKVAGIWLPFTMRGSVDLQAGHLFVYTPDSIEIGAIETKGLLDAINLQLSELLDIESEGAQFDENQVVLDLYTALPPPRQQVNVSNMTIDEAGVHLSLSGEFDPEFPEPIVARDSYILLQGGDVKIQRAVVLDARMQLMAEDGGKLDGSLYTYRDQLTAGSMDITSAGELAIYLGAYEPADYLGPALPENGDDS